MDISTVIAGIATAAGITGGVAGLKAWAVSHGLRALEIEGPRAVAVAADAYAGAVAAGRSQALAGQAAWHAAKNHLLATISGPLQALKKDETVVNATAAGIAAQAVQAATKLGVPSSLTPALTAAAALAQPAVVSFAEGELAKLAAAVSPASSTPSAPAAT